MNLHDYSHKTSSSFRTFPSERIIPNDLTQNVFNDGYFIDNSIIMENIALNRKLIIYTKGCFECEIVFKDIDPIINEKTGVDELINDPNNCEDELRNEPMKKYLDNVDFVDSEIIHSKRLVSGREGIVKKNSTSVGPSESSPVIVEEKGAKIRKVCHVIDLTDEFKTTEYLEEVFNVVEVVDLSN